MKRLLLVRHAQAVSADSAQTDFSRPLSDQGVVQAQALASLLMRANQIPDLMLVSSAQRTQMTASFLSKELGLISQNQRTLDELYLAPASLIEKVIQQTPEEINTLMVVAHNPGLSDFACRFAPWINSLKTGQMVCIQINATVWSEVGVRSVVSVNISN